MTFNEKEVLKNKLERLKFIKNATQRNIEFWCPGYTDTQNTEFKDDVFDKKELMDLLLDTAINYLKGVLNESNK